MVCSFINFSRVPIGLTLEQTINPDVASQGTGIAAFTNSISARKRWEQNHFLRMSVVSDLFDALNFIYLFIYLII